MTMRTGVGQQRFKAGQVMLGLAMLCAAPAVAAADPRGEALAGAARCQAIADDRAFLDCVYGAMQPLRAELGLQPAPPAQTRLVPPASVPMAPPVALTPPGRPAPAMASRAAPPREGLMADVFGSGKVEVSPQRMTDFRFDRNGFFTVTLADGATWKQLDGDSARAHWRGSPANLIVTVHAGAFGAHVLQVRGESATYKVIRLR
jgi:hypothetical protein